MDAQVKKLQIEITHVEMCDACRSAAAVAEDVLRRHSQRVQEVTITYSGLVDPVERRSVEPHRHSEKEEVMKGYDTWKLAYPSSYDDETECPFCEGELNDDGGCDACGIDDKYRMEYEIAYDSI